MHPPGAVSQFANEIRVCPVCGVAAPGAAGQCEVCQSPLGVRGHTVPNLLPGRPWARLELTVPCPRCATVLAPSPSAIDEGLSCHACGERTLLDVAWWDEVVHLAHAVVDLGHPDYFGTNAALGAFNPFAEVGQSLATARLPSERVPLQSTMQMRCGAGAPLCTRCASPVTLRMLSQGRSSAECQRCGEREAFALPQSLAARVVPLRVLLYFAQGQPVPGRIEPWWLLLEGTSSMRPMVQQQQEQSEQEAANQAAWAAWNLQERERQERELRLQEAQAQRGEADRQRREREAREKAEHERLTRTLRETQQRLDETAQALETARREADETRRGLEQSLQESRDAHQADVHRLQQESWQQGQYFQQQAQQREAQSQTRDAQQRQAHAEALAALQKKHKTRIIIAVVMWLLVFALVGVDVMLSLKP